MKIIRIESGSMKYTFILFILLFQSCKSDMNFQAIHCTHTGILMGIAPTGKKVTINVIDMIRLRDDKYAKHWGVRNLSEVIVEISRSRKLK
jgi:predicted ester cyclase